MARKLIPYLAYGSNLHPQRLRARVGAPLAARTVRLAGWSLRFHKRSRDGSGKCDIVPAGNQHIYGVIYSLTRAAKERLDDIEGVGFGYDITELRVPGVGTVTTYRAHDHAIDGGLSPYSWYHQLVLAGARHHGFPASYLDDLNGITTLEDPDRRRHSREMVIIKAR